MYQNYMNTALKPLTTATIAGISLTSTGITARFICTKQCKINRIMAFVTTALVADTATPVITVRKRPTPGSATGQTTVGTITVPDLTAIGKVLYKDVNPVEIDPGQELCFDVTTAATSAGSVAGASYMDFEGQDDPETPANEANMIKSA